MGCRMLLACGNFSSLKLFDSFKLMALNRNELHELNQHNWNFVHGDGWGIALGNRGRLAELYKSPIACWKDPRFLRYYNSDADFVALHARRKSLNSPVKLGYVQPFEQRGWYFCHNGTVYDFRLGKVSDSEQFFALLLNGLDNKINVRETIEKTLDKIKMYSALNFFLFNEEEAYVLCKFEKNKKGKEYPKYYSMRYLRNADYTIISSEKLRNFDGDWKEMENGAIFRVDMSSGDIERLDI